MQIISSSSPQPKTYIVLNDNEKKQQSKNYREYFEEMNINEKKKLTPAKGVRKQNNKNNKKEKKNLKYDTNTNANCLASLDKWNPPN